MPRGSRGAALYWERTTRYVRTTEQTTTGFKRPTYTGAGTYWCYTTDVKADKKLAYGIMNSLVEVEIHVRGFPAINPLDRMLIQTTGHYCEIKGIKLDYENGETVVVCMKVPTLDATYVEASE